MDVDTGKRIIKIKDRIVSNFDFEHWDEIGLLTGFSSQISEHPRLLRSLSWGDEDYAGNVLSIIKYIAESDIKLLNVIENYLDENFGDKTYYISAKPSEKRITFTPSVFNIPDIKIENDLVAVMMPFRAEFNSVYKAIQKACTVSEHRALRVDDVWEESTIVQDIFNLIFRSSIVIVDFTGKNPNVMYETGIAHTLGKLVIPLTQSKHDLPFDLAHHRALYYLPNEEGLLELEKKLSLKLNQTSTQIAANV